MMKTWWREHNERLVELMFQRLRNYPSTTITHFLKSEFKAYDFPRLLKVYGALELLLFVAYYFGREFNNPSVTSYVVEALVLFFFSFVILAYTLREHTGELLLQLHFRLLPGFKTRAAQLLALHRATLRPVVNASIYTISLPESHSRSLSSLEAELSIDPKAFCHKYFAKSGSGFVSFYTERAFLKQQNNKVDPVFVNYSLIIPKSKEMSVDYLRKILTAFSPLETGISLNYVTSKNRFNYLNLSSFQDFFNQLFRDYSPAQIERIFTNHQNRHFISRLVSYPEKYLTVFPVARSFAELEDLLREKVLPSKEVFKLEAKTIGDLEFKVLRNQAEYHRMGEIFSNCLGKYFDREDEVVVVAFKEKVPVACFSVENSTLKDIKGASNKETKYKTEIIRILRAQGIIR